MGNAGFMSSTVPQGKESILQGSVAFIAPKRVHHRGPLGDPFKGPYESKGSYRMEARPNLFPSPHQAGKSTPEAPYPRPTAQHSQYLTECSEGVTCDDDSQKFTGP